MTSDIKLALLSPVHTHGESPSVDEALNLPF